MLDEDLLADMLHDGIGGFDGGGLWVLTSTLCRHWAMFCGDWALCDDLTTT